MNRAEILSKVGESIASILDQPNLVVTMRTTAEDIEGWDSFNHVNIVVATEQAFGIRFSTPEIEKLKNVRELVALIGTKLAKK
jgi:acyl carrier protein